MNVDKLIATCGQELKIHECSSGKTLYNLPTLNDSNGVFEHITWSPSGRQLLAISTLYKPIVVRKDANEKKFGFTFDVLENMQYPTSGIFSKKSEEIATFGTVKGEIYSMDVNTQQVVETYTTLPSAVTFMDYASKDRLLATGCKNGQIFLHNSKGDVSSSFFVPWSGSLTSMIFHPHREMYLAAASREGVVAVWDVTSHTAKFVAKNHTRNVTGMAVSVSDELLATVGLDRKVYIYDLRTKDIVFNKLFSSELTAVDCSLTGQEFAISTVHGRVFFVDKRKPDCATTGSITAQKFCIRDIRYCNDPDEERSIKLKGPSSEPILVDNVVSSAQISNIGSDLKSQASGDFTVSEVKCASRIPGGMDDTLDNSAEQWIERIPDNIGDKEVPFLQVVEETSLNAMKQEIIRMNKDIVRSFMEEINAQFLKIRLGVSREFCRIEQNNNKRWQDFNTTLVKLAGCDDTGKEQDLLSDSATNVSQQTEMSKPESLFTPTKTKTGHYSSEN